MRWGGMTSDQYEKHMAQWRVKFALFPRQMESGDWVWLEEYETCAFFNQRQGCWRVLNRLIGDEFDYSMAIRNPARPEAPPPTKPKR